MKKTLVLLALTSCWSSATPAPAPDGEVTIEVASVTLADDCAKRMTITLESESRAGAADALYDCQQTSMQLALRGGAQPSTIHVKKVVLVDSKGVVLGELAAREPTRWTKAGLYEEWNESLDPDQTVKVSYALAAPDWRRVTGGRRGAVSQTFQVRVTLAIGTHERTIEKRATVAAMLEPMIET